MSGTGSRLIKAERIDELLDNRRRFLRYIGDSANLIDTSDLILALEQLKSLRAWAGKVVEKTPSLGEDLFLELLRIDRGYA